VNPIGPRACYDAETEILTEDGWVPFPSLRQDTAVATLTEAGEIEYHVPGEVTPRFGIPARSSFFSLDQGILGSGKGEIRSRPAPIPHS
jgi:UDP-glucuronate decarboxylase